MTEATSPGRQPPGPELLGDPAPAGPDRAGERRARPRSRAAGAELRHVHGYVPQSRRGGVGVVFGTVMTRIDANDEW